MKYQVRLQNKATGETKILPVDASTADEAMSFFDPSEYDISVDTPPSTSIVGPQESKLPDWVAGPDGGRQAMVSLLIFLMVIFGGVGLLFFMDTVDRSGGNSMAVLTVMVVASCLIAFAGSVIYYLRKIANR